VVSLTKTGKIGILSYEGWVIHGLRLCSRPGYTFPERLIVIENDKVPLEIRKLYEELVNDT
jgi:hypothetical protein